MNPIKIIFFDVDGTLVDHATGRISPKTFEALHRLQDNGYITCVATGRSPAVFPSFGDFQFDAFCAFNGSLCYTKEETIHSTPLTKDDIQKVLANATALGRPVSIATKHRLAANGSDEDLNDYYGLANAPLVIADDFDRVCQEEDVYQIMLGCRVSDGDAVVRGAEGVKIVFSWDRAGDVIPVFSGKGVAIQKILEHFHLDASQAMAFGDSNNDLQMFETVGTGIAMGNATETLKAIATDVCGPVSQDGIYHYCVEHGFI